MSAGADEPVCLIRPGLALALVALAASVFLAGCGPTDRQICGSLVVAAPLLYCGAVFFVFLYHRPWQAAKPALRFGGNIHIGAVVGLCLLAIYGGQYAAADVVLPALWIVGSSVLSLWMFLSWFALSSDWGFRWGGLIAVGLCVGPGLLGLLDRARDDFWLTVGAVIWLPTGGLGVITVLAYIALMIGAHRAAKRAALTDDLPG